MLILVLSPLIALVGMLVVARCRPACAILAVAPGAARTAVQALQIPYHARSARQRRRADSRRGAPVAAWGASCAEAASMSCRRSSTSCRRNVVRRSASAASGRSGSAACRPPRRSAGSHRLGAGQRRARGLRRRQGGAGHLVRSQRELPARSRHHRADGAEQFYSASTRIGTR